MLNWLWFRQRRSPKIGAAFLGLILVAAAAPTNAQEVKQPPPLLPEVPASISNAHDPWKEKGKPSSMTPPTTATSAENIGTRADETILFTDTEEHFRSRWQPHTKVFYDANTKTIEATGADNLGSITVASHWVAFCCELCWMDGKPMHFEIHFNKTPLSFKNVPDNKGRFMPVVVLYDAVGKVLSLYVDGQIADRATIFKDGFDGSLSCWFYGWFGGGAGTVRIRNLMVGGEQLKRKLARSPYNRPSVISNVPAGKSSPSLLSDETLEKEGRERRRHFLTGQAAAPAVPAAESQQSSLLPVPDNAAQAEATKLIKEEYGDEWAAAKTNEAKQALAKKLLEKARENEKDATARFVLLKLARDIATRGADGETAFQAVDEMDESFQIDALEMKLNVLMAGEKLARLPEQHQAIAEGVLPLIDQAVAKDKYEMANRLGQLAISTARNSKDKAFLKQVQASVRNVNEAAKAFGEVEAAKKTLEEKPLDPDANLAVGKYLCLIKGDWKQGRSMLLLGSDANLKALIVKEMEGATEAADQVKLGDGWRELAEKEAGVAKQNLQGRARTWYEKALPGLSGLVKDEVQKRVVELEQTEKDASQNGASPSTSKKTSPLAANSAHTATKAKKKRGQPATIYACCDDHCDIYVNGENVVHADRSTVITDCVLARGDVITVKCINDAGEYGFACAIVMGKGGIITTGPAWESYTPKSPETWFDPKGIQGARNVTVETSTMGRNIEEAFGKSPSYRLKGRHVVTESVPAIKCQGIWAFNDSTHCYLFLVVP